MKKANSKLARIRPNLGLRSEADIGLKASQILWEKYFHCRTFFFHSHCSFLSLLRRWRWRTPFGHCWPLPRMTRHKCWLRSFSKAKATTDSLVTCHSRGPASRPSTLEKRTQSHSVQQPSSQAHRPPFHRVLCLAHPTQNKNILWASEDSVGVLQPLLQPPRLHLLHPLLQKCKPSGSGGSGSGSCNSSKNVIFVCSFQLVWVC